MSIRREMLEVAAGARGALGASCELVVRFVRACRGNDGAFTGRDGRGDLYYTVFGLGTLVALAPPPAAAANTGDYLRGFAGGENLDFVHLTCLARCRALLGEGTRDGTATAAMLSRLETFRCADGGFSHTGAGSAATPYGCFLALGARQDLGGETHDAEALVRRVEASRSEDGGYANVPGAPAGSTPATAAAMVLLRNLGRAAEPAAARWLLDRFRTGGALAAPSAPIPDLLSTGTALFALRTAGADLSAIREECLDFVESLWDGRGGFRGHAADDRSDCEYTFYALLALGSLRP